MLLAKKKIRLRSLLMILSNGVTASIIFIFFLFLYSSTSGFIHHMVDSINRSDFEYIVYSVEKNYNEVINISKCISNNNKIKELITTCQNEDLGINTRIDAQNHITDILIGLKNYNSLIKSISIINSKKRYYSIDFLISMSATELLSKERLEETVFCYPSGSYNSTNSVNSDKHLIRDIEKEIYIKSGIYDEKIFYGNVFVLLTNNFFKEIVAEEKNILMYDNKNNVLFNSIENFGLNSKASDFRKNIEKLESSNEATIYKETLDNGWTILYLSHKNIFNIKQIPLNIIMLCSLAISFICSLFLSNYLSRSILHPVRSIIEFMGSYRHESRRNNRHIADTSKREVSLREKIFYYLIFTIMLPVALFITLIYFQVMYWAKEQISDQYMDTFSRTAKYVEKYFDNKSLVFKNIIYNPSVQEFIFDAKQNDRDALVDVFRNHKYLGVGRNEISIYSSDNTLFFSNYIDAASNIEGKLLDLLNGIKHGYVWCNTHDEINDQVFSILTKVVPIAVSKKYSQAPFYAKFQIPARDISHIYNNLRTSTFYIFISDEFGRDVFAESSNKLLLMGLKDDSGKVEMKIDGKKYMFFYHKILNTPWYLASKYNNQDISKQSSAIITSNIYLVTIVFLIIVVLSHFISLIILNPINIFNNLLEKYRFDDINTDMMKESFITEIDSLGINFNRMIERMEDMFDDLLIANREKNQLKLQIKAAEMVALQAQINPHFLYNTLDNLMYLIDNSFKKEAHQVIFSLSKLFRFGISRGDRIIPISEEVAYAKAYAQITSIRYRGSIKFLWDIDSRLLKYKTLKLILQPLLENAVFHGFKNMNSGCVISVKCCRGYDSIKFTVSDNGEGVPQGKLKEIKKDLNSDDIGERVGIFNVQARIQLQYGKGYGLDIDNGTNGGTIVTITVPIEEGVE